jgi:hypothetical protein
LEAVFGYLKNSFEIKPMSQVNEWLVWITVGSGQNQNANIKQISDCLE